MLIGLETLKKILEQRELETFSKLKRTLFIDKEEQEAFDSITSYLSRYGNLPPPILLDKVSADYDLNYYLDQLKTRYIDLKLIELKGLIEAEDRETSLELMSEILESSADNDEFVLKGDDISSLIQKDIEKLRDSAIRTGLIGLPTGWPTLNRITGGYNKGDVVVVSGRAKMGKTILLLFSTGHLLQAGYTVMFVSMEMTKEQILRRLVSIIGGINPESFRSGEITSFVEVRINEIVESIKDRLIIVEGQLKKNLFEIATIINVYKPSVVFIDGAYLIKSSRRYSSMWEEVSETIKDIKQIAIRSDLPIVCSYQLNRKASNRDELGLEHIALADSIGQIASCVIGIVDVEIPLQKKIEVIAVRDGQSDDFFINFNWETMNFSEIETIGGVI